MTLSRFLRDYLYIPLGGNRKGAIRTDVNLMTTMLLGGLWHGAGWNFIIWGGLHGACLVIHKLWLKWIPPIVRRVLTPRWMAWLFTFVAVVVGWVFFRATTFNSALVVLDGMFSTRFYLAEKTAHKLQDILFFIHLEASQSATRYLDASASKRLFYLFLIALLLPNTQQLMRRYRPALGVDENYSNNRILWSPSILWLTLILAMAVASLVNLNTVSEFLYFQF